MLENLASSEDARADRLIESLMNSAENKGHKSYCRQNAPKLRHKNIRNSNVVLIAF